MGVFYRWAWGVEQDYTKSFELHKSSAEKGDPFAQYKLGLLYIYNWSVGIRTEKGIEMISAGGLKTDGAEGIKWLKKSAENGVTKAQFMLGHFYQYGGSVEKNEKEAEKWYRLAAEGGDRDAESRLRSLEKGKKRGE
ncbi:Sel1 repeat protein [Candidatus Methanoplasma termitum]|uniref:Sel1 repeat protein n=1 Tax=Candidatus Methanoplasma termitum TaxID=1577791 RepID=A0A0A7LC20_9ARCH|nr:tetratricopeptide repeat protein [Candidatus Methanoplasma termitum]AIZ56720.1 Sel1 repeat protein [Candidatus Methanoplasma termitum]